MAIINEIIREIDPCDGCENWCITACCGVEINLETRVCSKCKEHSVTMCESCENDPDK